MIFFVDIHVFVPAGAGAHMRESQVNHSARRGYGVGGCQNVKERTSLRTRLSRHASASL